MKKILVSSFMQAFTDAGCEKDDKDVTQPEFSFSIEFRNHVERDVAIAFAKSNPLYGFTVAEANPGVPGVHTTTAVFRTCGLYIFGVAVENHDYALCIEQLLATAANDVLGLRLKQIGNSFKQGCCMTMYILDFSSVDMNDMSYFKDNPFIMHIEQGRSCRYKENLLMRTGEAERAGREVCE
jgi:hypothetical protein